jgi:hypothetical protein
MWICLNDAFLSIVKKDCPADSLLVRARFPGDIERVFASAKVQRTTDADYLFRAVVSRKDVQQALAGEVNRIDYDNLNDSVECGVLHDAYSKMWGIMAALQDPRPYSERYRAALPSAWEPLSAAETEKLIKESIKIHKVAVGKKKKSKKPARA